MTTSFDPDRVPEAWAFERRTPEQRLQWLQSALALAHQSGAREPRRRWSRWL
jgi:hypothetical protein